MRVLWYYCLAVPHLGGDEPINNRTPQCYAVIRYDTIRDAQRRFHAGARGVQTPKIVARPPNLAGPKFSRTVDTLWSIDSQFYPHDGAENQLA